MNRLKSIEIIALYAAATLAFFTAIVLIAQDESYEKVLLTIVFGFVIRILIILREIT